MTPPNTLRPPSLRTPRARAILQFLLDDRGVGRATLDSWLAGRALHLVFLGEGTGLKAAIVREGQIELLIPWRYEDLQEGTEALEAAGLLPPEGVCAETRLHACHCLLVGTVGTPCVACTQTGWAATPQTWRHLLAWAFLEPSWVLGVEALTVEYQRVLRGTVSPSWVHRWRPFDPPDERTWISAVDSVSPHRVYHEALHASGVRSCLLDAQGVSIHYPALVGQNPLLRLDPP